MSPSRQAKKVGLKNLKQVSEMTGQSIQTLSNWCKDKPELFDIVLFGCLAQIEWAIKDNNHKWINDSSLYAVEAGQSVKEFRELKSAATFARINKAEIIYRTCKARGES